MGAGKDLWMAEIERTIEDFAAGNITREEALSELRRLGLDRGEIDDMLDEAIA